MKKYPIIIIFNEKHGDLYYIANNKEELGKICCHVLSQRVEDGYWYYEPESLNIENHKLVDISDDLPEDVRESLEKRNKQIERKIFFHKQAVKEYNLIREAYKTKDPKLCYKILRSRSSCEYEGMEIITPLGINDI